MAMWLHQSGRCGSKFNIAMGDRLITAQILQSDLVGRSAIVRVFIGQPVVQTPHAFGRQVFVRNVALEDLPLPELIHPVVHVSMGNPHTVLFVRSLNEIAIESLGPRIETHSAFPNRTNVEFVEILPAENCSKNADQSSALSAVSVASQVRVWERGSGETMACGSGACAVAVAGITAGLFDELKPVTVGMQGGELRVLWDQGRNVYLEGPAAEVFRGDF